MTRVAFFGIVSICLLANALNAAIIQLQNPVNGSNELYLPANSSAEIDIVIVTSAIDTIQVAFVNAFLDDTSNDVTVTALNGGQNWTYLRTGFTLPANLDDEGGNEYGLVSGDSDGGDSIPLGSATHVIDTLTVITGSISGSVLVTFELGARQPQVFGPAPIYDPFTVAPPGFPRNSPNYLYVGDESSSNSPFTIYFESDFDCNKNGIEDADDIASGTSLDCNVNLIPDECEIADGSSDDVNSNGVPDECEPPVLLSATSMVTHGAIGPIGLDLELEGEATIDPRLDAGQTVVLTFQGALDPAVVEDTANILITRVSGGTIEASSFDAELDDSGLVLTLTFPGLLSQRLADRDRYIIDLSAFATGDAEFELGLLIGDTNQDSLVDPLDVGGVLSRFGGVITLFPTYDVNNDGIAIDPLDAGAVLSRLGNSAP